MVRNLWPIWIMFYYVFNIIKVNHFLYRFIILLHLFSSLSLTKSLLVPYAYVSIESIDCTFLSSFELRAILLISSVKTLCFLLLIVPFTVFLILILILFNIFNTVFYKFLMIFFNTIYIDFIFS